MRISCFPVSLSIRILSIKETQFTNFIHLLLSGTTLLYSENAEATLTVTHLLILSLLNPLICIRDTCHPSK
ncbi:unnamed protein product [Caenorhabditis nigoni]